MKGTSCGFTQEPLLAAWQNLTMMEWIQEDQLFHHFKSDWNVVTIGGIDDKGIHVHLINCHNFGSS